jgi:hypothetical protein
VGGIVWGGNHRMGPASMRACELTFPYVVRVWLMWYVASLQGSGTPSIAANVVMIQL